MVQTFAVSHRAAGRVGRVRQTQARRRRPAAQGRQGQPGHRESDAEGTGHRRRPGRIADRDQATRHQRRRLLQRQLGAPVRESDAAGQFPRGAGDPADPGGALLHLRADGGRHAPGLGDPRGDDDRVRRAARAYAWGPSRPATLPCAKLGRGPDRQRRAGRRQHGRQGDALRHRQLRAVGDRDHRRLERLGQFHARFVHAAWAGWCRCG